MTDGFDTPTAPPPPPPDFGPPPLADFGPPPPPPPSGGRGTLRRSSSDRVVAGVAGGLGEYFGLDPVLFRVLFAVTSFFGGAGVLAYIIGWAVIPERGAAQAPLDGVVTALRRRHVPLWLVATAAVILLWAGLFSWWAPGPAIPIVIAVVILVSVLSRRQGGRATATSPTDLAAAGVSSAPDAPTAGPTEAWLPETRSWIAESGVALQKKLRRTAPVRWATLGVLVTTIAILAISDAVGGILLPVYFWTAGAIVLAGLIVGLILRRTPWTLTVLLLPVVAGLIAFGGSRASLHDGAGQTTWTPTTAADLQSQYRLAFGRTTLDLRGLTLTGPQTVDVTMAAGQVRILVPSAMNVTVQADVHLGIVQIDPDGRAAGSGPNDVSGVNISREIAAPAGATGAPLTIKVHMADGNVSLIHS